MKRGERPPTARLSRARARGILALLICGLALLALGPLYAWTALNWSGTLALAQVAPADGVLKGFDFGPVYLEQDNPGRYFLSVTVPQTKADYWHTSFEVLDAQRTPVFKQDEMRFIGDFRFVPGQTERCVKSFTLDKNSGYYYFRFTAHGGDFGANLAAPPVVKFAIREGVIGGLWLWLPCVASMLFGALALFWFGQLTRGLGEPPRDRRHAGQPSPHAPVAAQWQAHAVRREKPRPRGSSSR